MVPFVKYVLVGLALVAAVAALFVRPPQLPFGSPPAAPRMTPGSGSGGASWSGSDGSGEVAAGTGADSPRPGAARGRVYPERSVVVYVAGEVVHPGVYTLHATDRVAAAVERAGGPKADADLVAVNLAAPLEDGEEIALVKVGAEPPRARRARSPRVGATRAPRRRRRSRTDAASNGAGDPAAPAPASLDLNSADAAELEAVPGIGPALAERIVDYRNTNGPFVSVDELGDVSGITPRLQDEIAAYLTVR
jgi:competence protein ComEA